LTIADNQTQVSVVIPVYNGARTIPRTIKCLLNQTYRPYEIIIVDDGSTDGTAQALEIYAGHVIYIFQPNRGPAAARNTGIKAARGNLIAFTDSDCLPDEGWLLNLVAEFDSPLVAGVGGLVKSADDSCIGQYIDEAGFLNPQSKNTNEVPYLITANACFRRAALLEAGLFDERFRKPGGEEPELCLRLSKLGYYFRTAQKALVFHHHRQTVVRLLKTMANYGEGAFIFGQLAPEKRYEHPHKLLAKTLIKLPFALRQASGYQPRYGIKKAIYFSFLDHLRHIALLMGYLRGMKRAA
jgi:glycosyltransferase involved in cell wall biosynthesis